MRKYIPLFALALSLAWPGVPPACAQEAVSMEYFQQSLDPLGEWLEVSDYGYVWHPRDVAKDWRPYTEGSWVYTDAGWTWFSDEPFGSIVYHYGRWVSLEDVGWVWVPDTEWAPAWVSWRRSERHVGWAPLPPEARFERTVGIREWSDSYYDVGPSNYVFVDVKRFGAPRLRQAILPPRENVTVIRETRNITNITVQNNVVFVGGPEYDVITRESTEPIRRLRLERRTDVAFQPGRTVRTEEYRTRIQGDTLAVFAPQVEVRRDIAPARVVRRIESVRVDRGWRGLGSQAEQLRTVIRQESPKPPAALPAQPRFERRTAATATAGEAAPAAATPAARSTARQPAAAGQDTAPTASTPADSARQPATSTERPTSRSGRRPASAAATPADVAATSPAPVAAETPAVTATATPARRGGSARQDTTRRPRGDRPPEPAAEAPADASAVKANTDKPTANASPAPADEAATKAPDSTPAATKRGPQRGQNPPPSPATAPEVAAPESTPPPAPRSTPRPRDAARPEANIPPEAPSRRDRPSRPENTDRPAPVERVNRPERPESVFTNDGSR